jgi:hypothetical protein
MNALETVMSEVKKVDCTSVEDSLKDLGVSRNTLNTYMNVLGVTKYKFPFDRRNYITKIDLERVRQFIVENKG